MSFFYIPKAEINILIHQWVEAETWQGGVSVRGEMIFSEHKSNIWKHEKYVVDWNLSIILSIPIKRDSTQLGQRHCMSATRRARRRHLNIARRHIFLPFMPNWLVTEQKHNSEWLFLGCSKMSDGNVFLCSALIKKLSEKAQTPSGWGN